MADWTRIASGAAAEAHVSANKTSESVCPLIFSMTSRVRAVLVPRLRPFGLPLSPGFQTIVRNNLLRQLKLQQTCGRGAKTPRPKTQATTPACPYNPPPPPSLVPTACRRKNRWRRWLPPTDFTKAVSSSAENQRPPSNCQRNIPLAEVGSLLGLPHPGVADTTPRCNAARWVADRGSRPGCSQARRRTATRRAAGRFHRVSRTHARPESDANGGRTHRLDRARRQHDRHRLRGQARYPGWRTGR